MRDDDLQALASLAAEHELRVSESIEIFTSPFLVLRDVLPAVERDRLFETLLSSEQQYFSNEMAGRRALVLHPAPTQIVQDCLASLKATIVSPFGFDPESLVSPLLNELAVSASGHGDFFGPHRDDRPPVSNPEIEARRVSVAFHLHRTPKRFAGGALRLHDYCIENGFAVPVQSFIEIEPEDNTLVAFLSSTRHEVDTVRLEENDFADRRFSITGSFTAPV